jgi:phosphate transport system permease protein
MCSLPSATEWGNFYGWVDGMREAGQETSRPAVSGLARDQGRPHGTHATSSATASSDDRADEMGSINYELERLRLRTRALELRRRSADDPRHAAIARVADDPREANTEGGIFPAIFGTV